jgi:hypothetical protein
MAEERTEEMMLVIDEGNSNLVSGGSVKFGVAGDPPSGSEPLRVSIAGANPKGLTIHTAEGKADEAIPLHSGPCTVCGVSHAVHYKASLYYLDNTAEDRVELAAAEFDVAAEEVQPVEPAPAEGYRH